MSSYNPKNERIKREYFIVLREADQMAETTIDGIRKALLRYEECTGFEDFASFDKDKAITFKRWLQKQIAVRSAKPLSPATIYSTLQVVQAFFRWLARQPGYRSKIVAGDIRFLNLPRKDVAIATAARSKRYPTLEQVRAVIAAMPFDSEVERRNRALLALAILTGIRISALASLRLKHIDIHQRLIFQEPDQVKTKFSKRIETFFFEIGDDLQQIVIDWVTYLRETKLFGNDDPLFPRTKIMVAKEKGFTDAGIEPVGWSSGGQVRLILKTAFLNAGLPYYNPHSFRDTLTIFGEQVCRTPEEFKSWSQNLGHQNPLTTFTSYGKVPLHRQGDLIRNMGKREDREDKLDRLMHMMETMQKRSADEPKAD